MDDLTKAIITLPKKTFVNNFTKKGRERNRRIHEVFRYGGDYAVALVKGIPFAQSYLENPIMHSLATAIEDFGFSKNVNEKKLFDAYFAHVYNNGDKLGLMLSEFEHMVEAMRTSKDLMGIGPEEWSKHRDAIGIAALCHDIYAITKKPGSKGGDTLSLSDYLQRNIGHEQEKKYNKEIIQELAKEMIGQEDELHHRVVAAVDYSSGKHKMTESEWNNTQWVTPMRIADNISTQRTYGDRHMHLVYNWACDVAQGIESEEDVAKRIKKRQGFCKRLAKGGIKELIQ
ncbi:MAG: hypothetical protein KJ922_03835, partial [Nanoarchaeota archaeon]|nr:hypothetical protein [Nanoarchaeota archaeon]